MMKILAIGDTADNIYDLKTFAQRSHIHLITFPPKKAEKKTLSKKGVEVFDSLLISKQIKKINEIKNNFDLCIVVSWSAARIAYLAGLNYIIFFAGNDIRTPPFVKNPRDPYLNNPVSSHNFLERQFYKAVLETAVACAVGNAEFDQLLKYRKDGIRLDRVFVNTKNFNENISPINLKKEKFTFLAAQKIGLEKGYEIIWEALKICKSDFEILQVEWFTERTSEEAEINKKLLQEKPHQVKLIPLIKREELGKYYQFADAILGQMRSGFQSGIERDAAYCKRPIICYTDESRPMIIDNKKVIPPFLPKSKDPKELSELIDRIVESKPFRNKLAEDEFQYIRNLSDPEKVANDWENIFENLIQIHKTIHNKKSKIILKIENWFVNIVEKYIYSKTMKSKNIESWGEDEYTKLTS